MWKAATIASGDGMTPLERATILTVQMLLIGLAAIWLGTDSLPEGMTAWDLLAACIANVAIGLGSSWRLWVRSLAVGSLGAVLILFTHWAVGLQHALATGFVVSNVVSSVMQAGLIGAIDLPLAWRRWCTKASRRGARIARWSAYYVATGAIWFLLLLSTEGLVDAATNIVLPLGKLAKSQTEMMAYVACLVIGGGTLLLAYWLSGARGGRQIRVLRPALVAAVAVILFYSLVELVKLANVFLGIHMPTVVVLGEAVDPSEDARRWMSDPRGAIGEALAIIATLCVPAIPIAVALTAWWDRARFQNRRSRLIATLVCLGILAGCTVLIAMGSNLALKAATGEVPQFGSWVGTAVGFGVGLRLSYLLLCSQWGKGPSAVANRGSPIPLPSGP